MAIASNKTGNALKCSIPNRFLLFRDFHCQLQKKLQIELQIATTDGCC